MSSSDPLPFHVAVTGPHPGAATVTVLDGHDETVASGVGDVDVGLPKGLYTVRVERSGIVDETTVRHAEATELAMPAPQRLSAVPASDTASTHEYYSGPAAQFCVVATAPPLGVGGNGSLFIFLRQPSADFPALLSPDTRLAIVDYEGVELMRLDHSTTQSDPDAGWLAFHAAAPPGDYVLVYEDEENGRELALAVFAGFQTQLFMTAAPQPLFSSASILTSRGGFDTYDPVVQAVDVTVLGLQNGVDLLPAEFRSSVLAGDFDDPMLGLAGGHALLRSSPADPDAMAAVVGRLRKLIGSAPDVRALSILSGSTDDLGDAFTHPPLMRAGLDAILAAATREHASLVPVDSLLARIGPRRRIDSTWSTWDPVVSLDAVSTAEPPAWLNHYVENAWRTAASRDEAFDPSIAAAKVDLPANAVAGAYEHVRTTAAPGEARTIELEQIFARARIEAPRRWAKRSAADATKQFRTGSAGQRVEAIAAMQGDPRLRDVNVAIDGITNSKSAFEQYHALRLARQMLPTLDVSGRKKLGIAIERQRSADGWIVPGSARWNLSAGLLTDMGKLPYE